MRTLLLALALLVALPLACHTAGAARDGVAFENLQRGYSSGLRDAAVRVARDADEWSRLWKLHNSTVLDAPTELAVDFSRDMVVCVTIGDRPTAGYAVEVRALRLVDGVLHVEAIETKPDAHAYLPQIVTQPYHFVTTRKTDARVVLDLR